jgi:hypothetical protein
MTLVSAKLNLYITLAFGNANGLLVLNVPLLGHTLTIPHCGLLSLINTSMNLVISKVISKCGSFKWAYIMFRGRLKMKKKSCICRQLISTDEMGCGHLI